MTLRKEEQKDEGGKVLFVHSEVKKKNPWQNHI